MANPGRYRADHIGSLLRPAELALPSQAAATTPEQQQAIDHAIQRAVTLQRELGLNVATDGELRRSGPTSMLDIEDGRPRVVKEMQCLQALLVASPGSLSTPCKISLPAPGVVPAGLAGAWRHAMQELIAGGVEYIQLQNTEYARLLTGGGAAHELETMLAADIAGLEGLTRPENVRVALYVGRGASARVGLFDTENAAFAEKLFSTLPVERFVLDIDDDASGGFETLKHVPQARSVALGLVSTRTPVVESRDAILDRLDEAAACMDGDYMALCPQSGFAGTSLSGDDQRRKLALVVSVSTRYWGFEA